MRLKRVKGLFRGYPSKATLYLFGILLCLILSLNPIEGHAKDYYIKEAIVNIKVNPDGLVRFTEKITYSFSGRFRFVERVIPLKGLEVENLSASVKGASALFQKRIEKGRGIVITAYISEDPKNISMGVENKDVTLIVSYNLKRAIKLFQDVSELFPKLWGEGWEKPLRALNCEIELPEKEGEISLWVHPKDYLVSFKRKETSLLLSFKDIPANQFVEVRLIMPKEWFLSAPFVQIYDYPALSKIREIEASYERNRKIILGIAITLIFLAFFIPIFIYIKWGKEVKIPYNAPYEHEPPYPDPPSFVNAIMMGKIGIPTLEGFIASILELIRKGFIEMKDGRGSDVILKIREMDDANLPTPEREILKFLKEEIRDEEKGWKALTKKWGKSMKFEKFFDSWKEMVTWELHPERFFTKTGSKLLKIYGAIALFLGIALIIISSSSDHRMFYPREWGICIVSLSILTLSGMVSLFMPEQVGGRWTPFGRLYYMRWNAFKRFLSDFSLIKLHPPSSIAIWDKYLVYATALGVAEKTWKAMKFIVPKEVAQESTFYPVWDTPHSWIGNFSSSLTEAYYTTNLKRSSKESPFSGFLGGGGVGGIGGIGGGFGGGGGRAG